VFTKFLERILPSEALRRFVQRVVGYAATGEVSEKVFAILHGVGANGKTTLVNAILETLGDYAKQAAPYLLLVKHSSHPSSSPTSLVLGSSHLMRQTRAVGWRRGW
jgi:putative DNA primase/helicase